MTEGLPALVGDDGVARCPWGGSPAMLAYHDTEWGMPVTGETAMFERLSLEGFQAGLSWLTILNKRERFREVFHGFDAEACAALTDDDVERLMQDVGIVRNRAKILATRKNGAAVVRLREEGGLEAFVRSFRPRADAGAAHDRRGADGLRRVEGAVEGASRAGVRVRRTDDDARADGGDRHRRHPPRRLPPSRCQRGVAP